MQYPNVLRELEVELEERGARRRFTDRFMQKKGPLYVFSISQILKVHETMLESMSVDQIKALLEVEAKRHLEASFNAFLGMLKEH